MHPHGNWTSTLPHELSAHAGTFLLEGRGSQVISLTWPLVLGGIKQLQGTDSGGVLASHESMLFTHRLFRVCSFVLKNGPATHLHWPSLAQQITTLELTKLFECAMYRATLMSNR